MSELIPDPSATGKGQFLFYEAEDGRVKIDVRLADETVWLTHQLIAELFQTSVPNISMHIRNVYEEGELQPEATIKKFLTVRHEGSRAVRRQPVLVQFMGLAVGCAGCIEPLKKRPRGRVREPRAHLSTTPSMCQMARRHAIHR